MTNIELVTPNALSRLSPTLRKKMLIKRVDVVLGTVSVIVSEMALNLRRKILEDYIRMRKFTFKDGLTAPKSRSIIGRNERHFEEMKQGTYASPTSPQ